MLVQDQDLSIAQMGASKSHFLPFATGEINSPFKTAAEGLIVALGQPADNFFGEALIGRGADAELVVEFLNLSDADIFRCGHFEPGEILENYADFFSQIIQI